MKRTATTKKETMRIVKGEMPPLSTEQRRLVEIFVWYLRAIAGKPKPKRGRLGFETEVAELLAEVEKLPADRQGQFRRELERERER